jgi:hypothetical protein
MNKPPKLTSQQQIQVLGSLAQGAAAAIVGLSARTFRDSDAPRNADGTYDARELARWIRKTSTQSDDLLAGGDSPALERYRIARAQSAELDLSERRGKLVDVDAMAEWFGAEVAAPIRRAIGTLRTRFGDEAAELISEAIDKAETFSRKKEISQ